MSGRRALWFSAAAVLGVLTGYTVAKRVQHQHREETGHRRLLLSWRRFQHSLGGLGGFLTFFAVARLCFFFALGGRFFAGAIFGFRLFALFRVCGGGLLFGFFFFLGCVLGRLFRFFLIGVRFFFGFFFRRAARRFEFVNRGTDLDRVAFADQQLDDLTGLRRRNRHRRLVGLDLHQVLIGLNRIAFANQDRQHVARFNILAEIR